MSQVIYPNTNRRVCFHCRYFCSAIGIGQGLRCEHPDKKSDNGKAYLIPGRFHTCELFERKPFVISNDKLSLPDESLEKLNLLIETWHASDCLNAKAKRVINVNFTFSEQDRIVYLESATNQKIVHINRW